MNTDKLMEIVRELEEDESMYRNAALREGINGNYLAEEYERMKEFHTRANIFGKYAKLLREAVVEPQDIE